MNYTICQLCRAKQKHISDLLLHWEYTHGGWAVTLPQEKPPQPNPAAIEAIRLRQRNAYDPVKRQERYVRTGK